MAGAPITARTSVVGLVGFPARHSLSPAIHNAAYRVLGLDAVFCAFEVPPTDLTAAVLGAKALGLVGMAVTVPHKQEVLSVLDGLAPSAEAVGAVNWVQFGDGGTIGHNTDGVGFLQSLAEAGVDVSGRTVAVLGAGGAARSIVFALKGAQADVRVTARRLDRAHELADSAEVTVVDISAAMDAEIVVNCTPVGMVGGSAETTLPVPVGSLSACHTVVDIVYAPEQTPLLVAAREAGATTVGGLGMLIHQAAEQIRLWSGRNAPIDAMTEAARLEQASRQR